ncbi:DUF5011 domain-containing protein [Paenibacillus campinasensis]|uniref:DUF5011 domain-containing protein n=1 Tax=Paenibacillus campinasensis TaxID=66347 RepID=A0ABW9T5W3_9BACL|nr:S-layer homology domain-containing protein [Paenibacillus campinasensis]MUG68723.1 DUF5011 domain-containing protein [Paenibacillus campinasensis]
MKRLRYGIVILFLLVGLHIPAEVMAQTKKISDLNAGDTVYYSGQEWVYLANLASQPDGLFIANDSVNVRYYYNSGSPYDVDVNFNLSDPLSVAYWLNTEFISRLSNSDWIQTGSWYRGSVSAKIGLISMDEAELNRSVLLQHLNPVRNYYTLTPATDFAMNLMNIRDYDANGFISPVSASTGEPQGIAPVIYLNTDLYVYEGEVVSCTPPDLTMTPADANGKWNQHVSVALHGGSCYNGTGDAQYRIQTSDGQWGAWQDDSAPIEFATEGRYILETRMSVAGSGVREAEIRIDQTSPSIALRVDDTAWTGSNVTVTADVYDLASGIDTQKWAAGDQPVSYFGQSGASLNGTFEASENGVYTVYARDMAGNETVATIEIDNIDREKPIITLTGDERTSIVQGAAFIDPGASAFDNQDGDLSGSIVVTGAVDTSRAGQYTLYYDVTDSAGNAADQVTRIVEVTPAASGGGESGESGGSGGSGGGGAGESGSSGDGAGPIPAPSMPGTGNTISSAGGSVTLQGATIQIPRNAVSELTRLHVELVQTIDKLPDFERVMSDVFEISKNTATPFLFPIQITLPFHSSLVDEANSRISLFWLNEQSGEWIELDNVQVDWQAGTVTGEVDHFTKFAVLATVDETEEQVQPQEKIFADMKGHWAEASVNELTRLHVISGYPDGRFKPERMMTRAEFVTIFVQAFGIMETTGKVFEDTASHWARASISTAYASGIIHGYDEKTFGADDPITREQIARIIANVAPLAGTGAVPHYTDRDDIASWATDAVEAAASHGLLIGYPDGSFRPQQSATRAEGAAFIWRLLRERQ